MAHDVDDVLDDELDFGEDFGGEPEVVEDEIELDDQILFEEPPKESNVLDIFLESRGFKDGKIKIIGEDSKEETIDFYSLSREEQLEILKDSPEQPPLGLQEEEVQFLNNLRSGNLTLKEYLDQYKQDILKEAPTQIEENYDIDAYDDQELFLLDQKAKYDLTDEEAMKVLTKELEDEVLFKKKMDKTREEYKQLEDAYKKEQQDNYNKDQQDRYNTFVDQMVQVATQSNDLYGIELEDSEKNEVLSFLLELDDSGVSNFYKQLQDPNKLYEAAWFLRYGKEAMDALSNAYEQEIAKLKTDKTQVVVRNKDSNRIKSIHEI
jgi:hypothetical protein